MVRLVGLRCCPPWRCSARGRGRHCLRGPMLRGRLPFLGEARGTLLTFAPAFPTRPGPAARTPVWMPIRAASTFPTSRCGVQRSPDQPGGPSFLSWGCPKIPSVVLLSGESTPGVDRRLPVVRLLRDENARSHPCSDLVVWCHLAGFLLPAGARVLQRASDHGVHRVSADGGGRSGACTPSLPAPSRFPAMLSCPSKRSLRSQRQGSFLRRLPAGSRHRSSCHQANVHRDPCPPVVTVASRMGSCLLIRAAPTRPQGVAPCPGPLRQPRCRCCHPVLPWAWMFSRRRARKRAHVRETSGTSKTVREEIGRAHV